MAELVFSQVAAWWRSKPEEVVELEPEEDAALNKSRSTDADTSQSSGKMSSVVFEIVGDAAETTGLIAEDMDEDGAESAANDSGEIPARDDNDDEEEVYAGKPPSFVDFNYDRDHLRELAEKFGPPSRRT